MYEKLNLPTWQETSFIRDKLKDHYIRELFKGLKRLFYWFIGFGIAFLLTLFFRTPEDHLPIDWLAVTLVLTWLFCGTTFSFERYLKFQLIRVARIKHDHETVKRIFNKKFPFAFYLRDFRSGSTRHSFRNPGMSGGTYDYYGSRRFTKISRKISKYLPVLFLHNGNEISHGYKGFALYCSDETWFERFKVLADNCEIIIVDYRDEFKNSENIRAELNYIAGIRKPIIIFSEFEYFTMLKNEFPGLEKNIVVYNEIKQMPAYGLGDPGSELGASIDYSADLYTFLRSQKSQLANKMLG